MKLKINRVLFPVLAVGAVAMLLLGLCGCVSQKPAGPAEALAPAADSPAQAGGISFAGGDGRSKGQAIVIKGAPNSSAGIDAEYAWLRKYRPGWVKGAQALLNENDKYYDRIDLITPQGENKTIFFDITDFFGKW